MPKLSDTMTVGTVVKWHKNKGDPVSNGDILAEIETDKATMELENFEDGILLEIFVEAGLEAAIGSPLAVVGEAGEDISSLIPKDDPEPVASEESSDEKETPTGVSKPSSEEEIAHEEVDHQLQVASADPIISNSGSSRVVASPLAKKIALEKNIDLSNIAGSGPHGRIIKKDLDKENLKDVISSKPNLEPIKHSHISTGILEQKRIPVSKMRSVIASRLLESKTTIPHFYLQKEINAQPLRLAREAINNKLVERSSGEGQQAPRISINDLVLKACAETIKWHPSINTSWEDKNIQFHGSVNLAFGVAIEDGLLTPVVNQAEKLSLIELSAQAKTLINKARARKLLPDEMLGSTFTVTNLGMFGIDFFSGIINPPNAAILSVGASSQKPVAGTSNNIVMGETMMLGLSCDHRLVDGAIAAKFLQSLSENLENPSSMLV
ncbi:MAG: dihydrolipoamide acetyltransferase family protein [Opitutales bacterium]